MMAFEFKPAAFPENAIHVSIDLETTSTSNDACIVQIGAAYWIPGEGIKTFEERIAPCSNDAYNRVSDVATLAWWDKQDPKLRQYVFGGSTDLKQALENFLEWCEYISNDNLDRIVLWGNGVDFDCAILKSAYETFMEYPFDFRNHHHLRTLRCMVDEEIQKAAYTAFMETCSTARPHHAVDDAVYQLYQIESILDKVR